MAWKTRKTGTSNQIGMKFPVTKVERTKYIPKNFGIKKIIRVETQPDVEVIPSGHCYDYTFHYVVDAMERGDENFKVVQATVHDPWDKHSYLHAWIEKDGKVYDWQTMVAGLSKWAGRGWDIDAFYETYEPVSVNKYAPVEALALACKQGHTHWKR